MLAQHVLALVKVKIILISLTLWVSPLNDVWSAGKTTDSGMSECSISSLQDQHRHTQHFKNFYLYE